MHIYFYTKKLKIIKIEFNNIYNKITQINNDN